LRGSAKVFQTVRLSEQVKMQLLEKAKHLYHISKTPESYWQQLTELLIANEWSVKQTEEICKAVREINIPAIYPCKVSVSSL
jgi:signal recognition particle GTPase